MANISYSAKIKIQPLAAFIDEEQEEEPGPLGIEEVLSDVSTPYGS